MDKDGRNPNANDETIISSGGSPGALTASGSSGFPSDAPTLQIGRTLAGRYKIISLLGQGGMGAVYKAQDLELDRAVALKVIRPELASNADILHRFKQELINARQVTHKNVIRIFDLSEDAGIRFITMEFVEGEDLRAYVARVGKLSVQEAVGTILQVCRGLEAAHAEGIIHRDLKPQNIIRQNNGRVLVMDFGLARSVDSDKMTISGALLGTLEYMSPEQANGKELDGRSDLFTLGIIFYELLTGSAPYQADSAIASLIKRSSERATPVIEIDPTVPRVISDVVYRCLEPALTDRYQSATEIIRDLDSWCAGNETVVSSSRTRALPAVRAKRPLRTAGIVAAILLVLSAATGVFFFWNRSSREAQSHKPITILVTDFDNKTGEDVFDNTLEPALSVAMEGASFISSYSRSQAHKIAAQMKPGTTVVDESLGRLIATREGITLVLTGSIEKSAANYLVHVKAVDSATGNVIGDESTDVADKSEVLPALNKVASKLRKTLGDKKSNSGAADETYTAASLEAAHEYAEGQKAQQSGKLDEAMTHFQNATKIDPSMGRAYAGLAIVYQNLGKRAESEQNYKLALERLDRMTDRERFRTRGGYYLVTHKAQQAMQEMAALVQQYPSDSAGIANLALAYFYQRDMQKALEYGRKSIEIFPKNVPQRNNVGLYAMYAGKFDDAIAQQKTVLELNPSFALAYVGMGLSQLGLNKPQDAAETFNRLASLNAGAKSTAALALADVALYQGKYQSVISNLPAAIEADVKAKDAGSAALKQLALGDAYLALGKNPQAVSAAETAIKLSQEDPVMIAAGRIFAAAGAAASVKPIIAQLAKKVEPDPQAYSKLLEGELALHTGNVPEAVRLLRQSQSSADTWLVHFDLGRAYLAANGAAEADSEFEICQRRAGEATALYLDESPTFHIYPEVLYYRAMAKQGLNSPSAGEMFSAFIAIKQNGDANPMLQDANRRLKK